MKSTEKESIFADFTGATYKPRKPWRCKLQTFGCKKQKFALTVPVNGAGRV